MKFKNKYSELLYNYMRASDLLIKIIIEESQNGKVPASVVIAAAEVSRQVIEMEKYTAVQNEHRKS